MNLILIVLIALMALHLIFCIVKLLRGKKDDIHSGAHVFALAYFLIELCRYKLILDQLSPINTGIYNSFKMAYFIILAFEICINKADGWNYSFIASVLLMQSGWSIGCDTITLFGFVLCISLFVVKLCLNSIILSGINRSATAIHWSDSIELSDG
jgi:hypothetical protein